MTNQERFLTLYTQKMQEFRELAHKLQSAAEDAKKEMGRLEGKSGTMFEDDLQANYQSGLCDAYGQSSRWISEILGDKSPDDEYVPIGG